MLGVSRSEIKLEPYHQEWKALFEQEKQRLLSILDGNVVDNYHIGSTAIPGVIAKPLLDIAIAVRDISILDIPAFERLGYIFRGEAGVEGRRFFVKRISEDVSTHHIHCYAMGHPALKNQLIFCKYLNDHPECVAQYNELKLSLKKENRSREEYTDGKGEFIKMICDLAQEE